MSIEQVTRPREDGTSTLLCGHPACAAVAETLIEITWLDSGWSGIIGACWEHHEDLGVLVLKGRQDEDQEVPRD